MAAFTLDSMSQARSWQELATGFCWQVPAPFNLGRDCRGRHGSAPGHPSRGFNPPLIVPISALHIVRCRTKCLCPQTKPPFAP